MILITLLPVSAACRKQIKSDQAQKIIPSFYLSMTQTEWHEKANKEQKKSGIGQKNRELRGYLLLLERIKIGLNQLIVCLLFSCFTHSSPLLTDQILESSFELWYYRKEEYMCYWSSQCHRADYLYLLCLYFITTFQCTNDMMSLC